MPWTVISQPAACNASAGGAYHRACDEVQAVVPCIGPGRRDAGEPRGRTPPASAGLGGDPGAEVDPAGAARRCVRAHIVAAGRGRRARGAEADAPVAGRRDGGTGARARRGAASPRARSPQAREGVGAPGPASRRRGGRPGCRRAARGPGAGARSGARAPRRAGARARGREQQLDARGRELEQRLANSEEDVQRLLVEQEELDRGRLAALEAARVELLTADDAALAADRGGRRGAGAAGNAGAGTGRAATDARPGERGVGPRRTIARTSSLRWRQSTTVAQPSWTRARWSSPSLTAPSRLSERRSHAQARELAERTRVVDGQAGANAERARDLEEARRSLAADRAGTGGAWPCAGRARGLARRAGARAGGPPARARCSSGRARRGGTPAGRAAGGARSPARGIPRPLRLPSP